MITNCTLVARSSAQVDAVEHFRAGRFEDAVRAFRLAVDERPCDPDLRYNLGTVLAADGRHESAVGEFRVGLGFRPHDAAMLNNLGNSLMAMGILEDAEEAFAQALKYDRRNATILANRARALNLLAVKRRSRSEEAAALPLLRLAVELQPDFAEGWANLGTVLHDLRNLEEGESALRRALALRPEYPLALGNLGNLLIDEGRIEEALALYESAAKLAPASAVAHWNLALALLATGDLARGFSEFEWRLDLAQAASLYPDRGVPTWRGEALAGRRILIYAEQGLGDTLQFVRYAPKLAALGAEVWLECQAPLQRLLAGRPELSGVVVPGEAYPPPDFACPLMSLPQRFATSLADVPVDLPYLSIDTERLAFWRDRFANRQRRPRVGLVWAGEPRKDQPDAHRIDRRRSMRLEDFAPLLEVDGVDFFSLQKGAAAAQLAGSPWAGRVTDWSEELTDFVETGAVVSLLDLVIGVDTSVVHLAGALAKPTWVLSRFDGCWRWLRDRDDSPWYPTLSLFRQQETLQWGPVVDAVRRRLVEWKATFGP